MEKHLRALTKVQRQILNLLNVRGVGVGYKRVGNIRTEKPAIIVFVEKKLPSGDLVRSQRVPAKLQGLDTDVVEIGRVRLLQERIHRIRPALPGSSIGHYNVSAGTFGAVVRDKKTGENLILSNNHILANGTNGFDGKAKPGDPILQPGGCDTMLKTRYNV
ncbi:MAG: hypothetical protein MJA84_17100 [Firmicutes bacterium]|nr:hypothetical protein [Bacillota bacterium]